MHPVIIGCVALYIIIAVIAFVWLFENDEPVWLQIIAAIFWPLLLLGALGGLFEDAGECDE